MPGVEVVPLDVLKKLLEFESSGGTVLWVNQTPSLPDDLNDIEEFKTLTQDLTSVSETRAQQLLFEKTKDELKIKKATNTLLVGKYLLEDARMYWLYNHNGANKDLTLTYESANGFDIYDPNTGEITTITGNSCAITIDPFSAKFVIIR